MIKVQKTESWSQIHINCVTERISINKFINWISIIITLKSSEIVNAFLTDLSVLSPTVWHLNKNTVTARFMWEYYNFDFLYIIYFQYNLIIWFQFASKWNTVIYFWHCLILWCSFLPHNFSTGHCIIARKGRIKLLKKIICWGKLMEHTCCCYCLDSRVSVSAIYNGEFHKLPLLQFIFSISL